MKLTDRPSDKNHFSRIAYSFSEKRVFFLLSVLSVLVSVVTLWNAVRLWTAIDRRMQNYVTDVSLPLADRLDLQLLHLYQDLQLLENHLSDVQNDMSEAALLAFLDKQAPLLEFSALAMIRPDGSALCTIPLPEDAAGLPGVRASFRGEQGVSFLDRQSILYSIPLWEGGQITGVVAGIQDREKMQQLMRSNAFSGQSLCCLIDTDGSVVISPTDLKPFLQLDDIFVTQSDRAAVGRIERMQEDMKNHRGGVFSFTATNRTDLILSYHPLDSYDWVLLTLVPSNLILQEVERYITRTFLITAGMILLLALILFVFFRASRAYYRQLERFAFEDLLTGEMNNAAFRLRCRELLQGAPAGTRSVALLNILNFKLINETYGAAEGDNTLRRVMESLSRSVSGDEAAARADADNFFLCLRENEPTAIARRLQKITDEINGPQWGESPCLSFSQGVYIVDEPALDITIIQDRAKSACRSLPHGAQGPAFYDSALTERLLREHELNDLFADSLKNGDFHVFLQPKVLLDGDRIAGAEALVRWHHPQRGMIYPSDFIPLFEKNEKICQLDLYVFEQVCLTLRRWIDSGLEPFPVSVNLSRRHFKQSDCLRPFEEIARRYRIPSGLLELELTESILFEDRAIETVKAQILEMHRMGFLCSLDDFGAGYSSLGLLMEFDVDSIKLDRRFFLRLSRRRSKDLVESIISLAHKIGAQTVAEGIETTDQLDFLREMGCDLVQGYVFSRPLPIPAFEDWMKNWPGRASDG